MRVKSLLPNRWLHEKLEYPEGVFRDAGEVFDMHPEDFSKYYHHVVSYISHGVYVDPTTKPKDYHMGNDDNTDPQRAKDGLDNEDPDDINNPHYHEHDHQDGYKYGHIHEHEDSNHSH